MIMIMITKGGRRNGGHFYKNKECEEVGPERLRRTFSFRVDVPAASCKALARSWGGATELQCFWKLSCKQSALMSAVLPTDAPAFSSLNTRGPLSTRAVPSLGPVTAAPLQSSAMRPTAFLESTTYRLIDIMWVGYRPNQRHVREKKFYLLWPLVLQ
jgi:hypothetical protein